MRKLINTDVLSAWPNWTAGSICFIRSLALAPLDEVNQESGIYHDDLALHLDVLCQQQDRTTSWPQLGQPFVPIKLLFYGVYNLSLSFVGKNQQVLGLELVHLQGYERAVGDISVKTQESDELSFLCREARVLSVARPLILFL